jgi:ABC-type multidrug transport system fused ATPase/permease subunit
MTEQTQENPPVLPAIRRLLKLSGKNQAWLYLAMLMILSGTFCQIVAMFAMARFVDAVLANNRGEFWRMLLISAVLFAATAPASFIRSRSIGLFSERTMMSLREKLAAQATVLPMRYLEERHTGDLLAVVNADLAMLKNLTASALLGVVQQSVMAVAASIALLIINWQLALASILMIPLLILVTSRLTQPVAKRAEEMQQAIGETVSVTQDSLGGLMVTKAFNLASVMDERFRQVNQKACDKGRALSRLQAVAADGGGKFFSLLPFLITLGFGGYLAINGRLTFGSLQAFLSILNYVAGPFYLLPGLIVSIREAAGSAQRAYQILDQAPERRGGKSFAPADRGPLVRFEHVDFSYGEEPVLKDLNLTIQVGQTVAVVGSSGGGKSTLLKLLLGFYPPKDNHLFLFEQDINAWSLAAARQQMAFVAQDTYLFPVSIAENIACGKIGAAQEEIERAARMANIHETIVSLPDGYTTLVGERGARLSGGQRQRISLARAILKNAPILLLDEPTSALDIESEALVQEGLDRFATGCTTIVIAHRLSTIRSADRVVVLEDGHIIEEGTHTELMQRAGRYKELYLRQFSGKNVPDEGGQDGK